MGAFLFTRCQEKYIASSFWGMCRYLIQARLNKRLILGLILSLMKLAIMQEM